jgi:glycine/D-amino acid oxidase-like deaminating enzyme
MLGITLAPATAEALAPRVLGEEPDGALEGLEPTRFMRAREVSGWNADRREPVATAGR